MGKNNSLVIKKKQCYNFLLVICIGGITFPLILHIFNLGNLTAFHAVIAIFSAFTPTAFAFYAYHKYDSAVSNKKKKTLTTPIKSHDEKHGDYLLYVGGILSIIFIAVYVGMSGGIKDNFMAYYFVFIPSATAVAFRTWKGLWFISLTSVICLIILYVWFYGQDKVGEYLFLSFWGLHLLIPLNLLFSIYQIALIIWLEYRTNKLN